MNWNEAEQHLKDCEAAYTAIGKAGLFALIYIISPLRERYNAGDVMNSDYADGGTPCEQ